MFTLEGMRRVILKITFSIFYNYNQSAFWWLPLFNYLMSEKMFNSELVPDYRSPGTTSYTTTYGGLWEYNTCYKHVISVLYAHARNAFPRHFYFLCSSLCCQWEKLYPGQIWPDLQSYHTTRQLPQRPLHRLHHESHGNLLQHRGLFRSLRRIRWREVCPGLRSVLCHQVGIWSISNEETDHLIIISPTDNDNG